ncbi:8873_t:CDS:2 [Funneliformis geosporum]|uniref:3694_t:CDS:1 n=1 Tax=Funneliformis geosporum TaxID=1117311 RepID=A0A9W4SGJ5_9GLOM|nr:3694_t:CDS:2 [Funneliformis geosporum]CAI2176416.1 8873_t:CDS:2 [Funneliformis geosporum]
MNELPKWRKGFVVKDTHTNPYLNGLKPDISVFVEEDVISFTDEDKGQLIDYINVLVEHQPLRELFAVFLSDGFQFYVMAFDRNTKRCSEFTTNLKTGLRLFWVLLNASSPFTKKSGPSSIDFYTSDKRLKKFQIKEFLGVGSSSTVYKIDWEDNISAIKLFKSGHDPSHEATIRRLLNGKNIKYIPKYVANDNYSLIIRPVCEKISGQFRAFHTLQLL